MCLADVQVLEKDLPGAIASLNAIIAKHPTGEARPSRSSPRCTGATKTRLPPRKFSRGLPNSILATSPRSWPSATPRSRPTTPPLQLATTKAALAVQPKHPAANNILGLLAFQQQHYQDAIAHFQIALTARPAWVDPIHSLASCYFQTQDLVKAEELFPQDCKHKARLRASLD